MPDVLILGGGLAGLACGHTCLEGGLEPLVLEASPRAGGVVGTREIDGFRFEAGPNTLQASAGSFRQLCGELGLDRELTVSDPSANVRWLWTAGALRPLPGSPPALLRTPLFDRSTKLRLASEPLRRWRPPAPSAPEPTLAELLEERLGREPTELLAGAFVRGIYAGDHTRLGARSAFPRLWSLLEQHGGLVRGLLAGRRRARRAQRKGAPSPPGPDVPATRLLSLPGGLQRLVDALVGRLGGHLQLESEVLGLRREGSEWVCERRQGGPLRAPRVVLCVGAEAAAGLLEPHLGSEHRAFVAGIPHSSVRLAHLGFAPGELSLPPGFGYLVPPRETGPEAPRSLGTIFASNLFGDRAPAGGAAVSCFYAAEAVEKLDAMSFCDLAAADLARALGLDSAPRPAATWTVLWRRSIPQYLPEHDRRFEALEADLGRRAPGLDLAGSWTRGVSVEHVIERGRKIGDGLVRSRSASES